MSELRNRVDKLEKRVKHLCWQVQNSSNTGGGNFQLLSEKAQPNGYASLGADGIVPASQLPPFSSDSYWTLIGNDIQNNNTGAVFSRGGGNQEDNTAYGKLSLLSNTSGTANTAFGHSALLLNTIGEGNVAFGAYALSENTIGDYNTAVGAFSMYASTSGDYNTAFGTSALQNHTTGRGNTAIGFHSLGSTDENLTGSYNIGLGFQAGRAVTTGSRNILLENTFNDGITTGSNNIILNPVNRSGITTGSGNVVIGGFNGTLSATLAETIVLGTGTGVERMRINSNGNIGVGTSTPSASAILDLTSTSKGFLVPRMSTLQRDAIASPSTGMLLYNTTKNSLNFRLPSSWYEIGQYKIEKSTVSTNTTITIQGTGYTVLNDGTQNIAYTIQQTGFADLMFVCSRLNINHNSLNYFRIERNGVVIKYTSLQTYQNEIHSCVVAIKNVAVNAGDIIRISANASTTDNGNQSSVYNATLLVDVTPSQMKL